jgi:hypothetical protein
LKRATVEANSRRYSGKTLLADDASFSGLPIFHYDYQRNQTSIREIRKFQSSGLVKDKMVWQTDVFEMRTK